LKKQLRMQVNGEMTMRLLAGELRTIDLTPRLGAIRCPTLILAGEDDPACPAEAAAEMASCCRRSSCASSALRMRDTR
jgi:proline iminopeptidase